LGVSIEITKTLPVRVAAALGSGALVFILLSSILFFNRTYHAELETIDRTLSQLAATVENSAAIAAYLGNAELASDVAGGLARNDIVAGAAVIGQNGMQQSSGDVTPTADFPFHHFTLKAPFPPAESVGEIRIKPNQILIEQRARQAALGQVMNLVVYTLVLLGSVVFITHFFLTRPIRSLARQLHDIEPGSDQRLQHPMWHKDNEIGELVSDTNGLLESVGTTLERERALRAKIEALERRFRLIFERASGGIALTDPEGRLHMFNPSFEQIFGGARLQQLLNSESFGFIDLFKEPREVAKALREVPGSKTPMAKDLQLPYEVDGIPRWVHCLFSSVTDDSGEMLIETIVYDISERTHRERQIRFEAERDPLTGLFNRRAGERRLQQILDSTQSKGSRCALLMIDLDRFKPINDTHGHEAGDRVLVEISRRLIDSVRGGDLVVRWGGDEFLIVVLQGHGELDAAAVANNVLDRFNEAIDLGNGHRGRVGASIGIAICPDHGREADRLIELADQAMYDVKEQGRNGFLLSYGEPAIGRKQ
jgi:diguanylate cyclase (GGDEF)-like protein/PAS domain S-box-containing protein